MSARARIRHRSGHGREAAEKAFCHDIFGLSMVHEDPDSAVLRFGGTLINLLDARAAAELIAPEEIGAPASVRAQMTIDVDDVAAQGVELLNGPMDRPWGVRTALFADPADTCGRWRRTFPEPTYGARVKGSRGHVRARVDAGTCAPRAWSPAHGGAAAGLPRR